MADTETPVERLSLLGGWLCLDFANTVDYRGSSRHVDYLLCYRDLVLWSRHVGMLSPEEAERLLRAAEQRPAEAAATLAQALDLREACHRLFSALTQGEAAQASDLAIVNSALKVAMSRLYLATDGNRFTWEWRDAAGALDRMLWPVARSAGELLTSTELERVRECAADACSWLFVDTSKNHSRRWCDMASCGNRSKARRLYQRRRGAQPVRP